MASSRDGLVHTKVLRGIMFRQRKYFCRVNTLTLLASSICDFIYLFLSHKLYTTVHCHHSSSHQLLGNQLLLGTGETAHVFIITGSFTIFSKKKINNRSAWNNDLMKLMPCRYIWLYLMSIAYLNTQQDQIAVYIFKLFVMLECACTPNFILLLSLCLLIQQVIHPLEGRQSSCICRASLGSRKGKTIHKKTCKIIKHLWAVKRYKTFIIFMLVETVAGNLGSDLNEVSDGERKPLKK